MPQPVPGAVVLGINVDRVTVGVDRGRRILELDVLVPHQGPVHVEGARRRKSTSPRDDLNRDLGVISADHAERKWRLSLRARRK